MSSATRVIYVGVTNKLEHRVYGHKNKLTPGFTAQYNVNKLVYFEQTNEVMVVIEREKQLKGWDRAKKVALIVKDNPGRLDLSRDWYGQGISCSIGRRVKTGWVRG